MLDLSSKVWIVISSSLGEPNKHKKWSETPLIMETGLMTKSEATIRAKELNKKYSGKFYVAEVDLSKKEEVR